MYKILPILLFAYGLSVTTDEIYDDSWALIIGIDKYQNVKRLNYAVADAESIKDILINSFDFPEENVSLITNDEATKQNIIKSFSTITKNAKSNDRVVVFFSGHGDTMDLPGGGEKGYLIPVEGDDEDLYVTSIPMDELKQIALMSEAKHMLYLVDACYGGLITVSKGMAKPKSPNYINKVSKYQSRQVISAGGRDEEVIEKPEWGHSAFTLNLNRGLRDGIADLNSDGYITATELGMYLSDKVTIDSDEQQTPQFGKMTSEEGEFIFINKPENIIINEATINIVDTTNTINYDILAKKIADELSNSNNEKTNEYSITEQSDKYYRLLISPYLGAGNLPYGIAGVSLGYNISKKSRLSLQYQIRGNESTYPYSQSDYNAINIGFTKFWGNNLNQYVSLGFGPSFLEYVSAEPIQPNTAARYTFEQDGGDMFIEIGTSLKRKSYLNPNISIRIGYSNIGGITTEDDSKYSLEGGYFMILGHFDLFKL